MSAALKFWELDNNVELIDPARDGLYAYEKSGVDAIKSENAWTKDAHHFRHVRISAIALIKMVTHARSGGAFEIMGLMQGYVRGDSFIVTDAFRLPVEGTETRVNAHEDANEYMVNYAQLCREQGGRNENVVGWYHSHPGYGCWLSGIDVGTQSQQQMFNEPFVAVVIDPDRTINSGKVDIGAFRTLPEPQHKIEDSIGADSRKKKKPLLAKADADSNPGAGGGSSSAAATAAPPAITSDGYETVPLDKVAEFGAHSSRYYPLEVTHFKSTLDSQLLELLWHKYWVQTLSQSPLFTGRDYGTKQIGDLASKVREVAAQLARANGTAVRSGLLQAPFQGRGIEKAMDKAVREAGAVAMRERGAMIAGGVKAKIFMGSKDGDEGSRSNNVPLPTSMSNTVVNVEMETT